MRIANQTMKLREHRNGLTESMAAVIDILPTLEALKIIINTELGKYGVPEITNEWSCPHLKRNIHEFSCS